MQDKPRRNAESNFIGLLNFIADPAIIVDGKGLFLIVNDAFTDLTGLRKNALSLLEVPNKIQIVDATENAPMVKLDAEKMCRVFVNIIKNAIDAMPESGTLTVKSREVNGKLEISFKDTVEQACQKKP